MNAVHAHLLLNHVPILGSLFGVLLLMIGMGMKNKTLEITGLSTMLLAALFTIPAFFSGEEAEHVIEGMSGFSDFHLEEHEEHAELSLWMMIASGLLSLISLVAYRFAPNRLKIVRLIALVLGLVAFLTMIPLANHGGKIMHQELRDHSQAMPHEDHD